MPANSGVMVIKTDVLKRYLPHIKNDNAQKEYYLTDIVDLLSVRCALYFLTDLFPKPKDLKKLRQLKSEKNEVKNKKIAP